jgi:hypothetical protein
MMPLHQREGKEIVVCVDYAELQRSMHEGFIAPRVSKSDAEIEALIPKELILGSYSFSF